MPRAPKSDHPLRHLRKILGPHATQSWMAGQIGIAPITMTKIENGDRLKLTSEHQSRLASLFGVSPFSFSDAAKGRIFDLFHDLYTKESLAKWREAQAHLTGDDFSFLGRNSGIATAALLRAAAGQGRFIETLMGFDRWLLSSIKEGLEESFHESCKELTRTPFERRIKIGDLYGPSADNRLFLMYEFPITPRWSTRAVATIRGVQWLVYMPVAGSTEVEERGGEDIVNFQAMRLHEEGTVTVMGQSWKFSTSPGFHLVSSRTLSESSRDPMNKTGVLSDLIKWEETLTALLVTRAEMGVLMGEA